MHGKDLVACADSVGADAAGDLVLQSLRPVLMMLNHEPYQHKHWSMTVRTTRRQRRLWPVMALFRLNVQSAQVESMLRAESVAMRTAPG